MDRYPDAPARIELLIDLTIWVAQASHSLLVTGKVRRVLRYGSGVYLGYRGWGWSELGPFMSSCVLLWQVQPQETRLGPVQEFNRVWWLSASLDVIEIHRNQIMFVETLYFAILLGTQPFRYYRPRFSVDEFQVGSIQWLARVGAIALPAAHTSPPAAVCSRTGHVAALLRVPQARHSCQQPAARAWRSGCAHRLLRRPAAGARTPPTPASHPTMSLTLDPTPAPLPPRAVCSRHALSLSHAACAQVHQLSQWRDGGRDGGHPRALRARRRRSAHPQQHGIASAAVRGHQPRDGRARSSVPGRVRCQRRHRGDPSWPRWFGFGMELGLGCGLLWRRG